MPAETGNGLAMRMGMFAEALSKIAKLQVIVVPVAGGDTDKSPLLRRICARLDVVPIQGRRDPKFELITGIRDPMFRLEAYRLYGLPSLSAFLSPKVINEISGFLRATSPDLLHIGRAYLMPIRQFAAQIPLATIDLDEADISSLHTQAKVARNNGDEWHASWLEQEGKLCDRLIVEHGKGFTRLFVASRLEAEKLGRLHPQTTFDVAENAVDIPSSIRQENNDDCTLLFVGSLSFEPNTRAIVDFCENVLPAVRRSSGLDSSLQLLIAGAKPPASIKALGSAPGVNVLGYVSDVAPLYRRATLSIAPLSAGGGTRIKLIESAAHGVASIATSIGAEGIEWPVRTGGWIADMYEPFIQACKTALSHPTERKHRAILGRNFVRQHHYRPDLISEISRQLLEVF